MKRNLNIQNILNAVLLFYNVDLNELKSESKKGNLVKARQIYFYLCKEFTDSTFSRMAKLINRDHATAMYSKNKIINQKELYQDINLEIEEITESLFRNNSLIINHVNLLQMSINYTNSFI